MKDTTPDTVYTDRADAYSQYHDGNDNALEREKSAQFWVERARVDAEAAAVQAKIAASYLNERYSQRRQDLAQATEDTAQLAAQNAHRAEEELLIGDFEATIKAGRASHHLVTQAHESARLAAIDETELGRCPHCMARLELLMPLPDATNHRTHFRCAACGTLWRAVHSSERVLLERITESQQE
jgi:hypothetical protein